MDSERHPQPTAVQDDPGRAQRFREMVDAHIHSLYRLALNFTGNPADAEDLIQETFMRAWRSFNTFRPGTNARGWLVTILRNAHIERYRRDKRREPETVATENIDEWYLYNRVQSAEFQQEADNPEAAFFSTVTSEQVASALRALPPQFREVFVLADLEGFPYREISEIVGIPQGTVMSRLHRARHRLQRTLWDYCLRTGQCRVPAATPPRSPLSPDCAEACRQIYRYLDKALDAAALAAIDHHLRRCHRCCDRFEFQRRLAATICEAQGMTKVPSRFRAQLDALVARFSDHTGATDHRPPAH